MRSYNHGRFQQQASFLRRQFLQDGDLPFTDVLSEGIVAQALTAIERRLARQDLFAAGDAVGVLGPGPQRRSFVPRSGRPLDRPSPFARTTSVLARRRALTAKLESVCRNNSSRRSPAWSGAPWTPRPTLNGFGRAGAFTCSTERR